MYRPEVTPKTNTQESELHSTEVFKIITVNIQKRFTQKFRKLLHINEVQTSDIILIQETLILKQDDKNTIREQFEYNIYENPGTTTSTGVTILTKKHLEIIRTQNLDPHGRALLVTFRLPNHKIIHLVNIYCPNLHPERETFLQNVFEKIPGGDLIIGGDWNFIENPKLDEIGDPQRKFTSKETRGRESPEIPAP